MVVAAFQNEALHADETALGIFVMNIFHGIESARLHDQLLGPHRGGIDAVDRIQLAVQLLVREALLSADLVFDAVQKVCHVFHRSHSFPYIYDTTNGEGCRGGRGSTDSKGSAGSTGKVAASPLFYNRRFAPHHNPEPNNLNHEPFFFCYNENNGITKGAPMTQLERLKDELITLTVRRGYPAELGALMAAELGTEKTITRMITYLTHVAPERAEDMVDEMLAIRSDRDFWADKKRSEYYQKQYNQMLWEEKNR